MRRICSRLLFLLAVMMFISIVIAILGFALAFVAALVAVITVAASSSPFTVSALLAVPVFGNLIIIGLVVMAFGIVAFLLGLVLYVVVDFLCDTLPVSVPADGQRRPVDMLPDPKDVLRHIAGIRCLLAPLFPAALMLLLAIMVTLLLFFSLRDAGYTLNSPGVGTLIIAVVVFLCVFGLLLALVPYVWCCCKCGKRGDLAGLLDPFLNALEFTADAAEVVGGAFGNVVKTALDESGERLGDAGKYVRTFKIPVPNADLDFLKHFGIQVIGEAIPNDIKVLRGDFRLEDKVPTGAELAADALSNSGTALKKSLELLDNVKDKSDTAARALRAFAAMLRSLTM